MGTCYTYLLYDEMDWYGHNKDDVIAEIKKELPVAEVLGQWYCYIVIDLDKNSPYGENVQKLSNYCDSALCYADHSSWDLKKVEFKPVRIKMHRYVDDNESKIRNQEHIDKANKEWTEKYDAQRSNN